MNHMFTRHTETLDASEQIKKKRNITLYDNRITSKDICMKNGKIQSVKSYEYFNNLVDGFYACKEKNFSSIDNSGCFNVWLDDASDLMTMTNTSDYYLTQADYADAELEGDLYSDEMALRDGKYWPFTKHGICGGQIVNDFTFFQPDNKIGVNIYAKNIRRKFPITNLN